MNRELKQKVNNKISEVKDEIKDTMDELKLKRIGLKKLYDIYTEKKDLLNEEEKQGISSLIESSRVEVEEVIPYLISKEKEFLEHINSLETIEEKYDAFLDFGFDFKDVVLN